MTDVVLWCGPVSTSNIADVTWRRPTTVITVGQGANGGIGSSAFAALGDSLGPRPLVALLDRHNVESADRIAVMGYSAGHGLIEKILRSEDATMVDALGAFDAYFVGFGQGPKPGYLAHCQRAARGEALAVVTTSSREATSGLGQPPSGPAANAAFFDLASEVPGLRRVPVPPGVPEPATMEGAGRFGWADYLEEPFGHEGHATKLAEVWADAVIAPYLAGEPIAFGPTSGRRIRRLAKILGLGALAVALAYVSFHAADRLT